MLSVAVYTLHDSVEITGCIHCFILKEYLIVADAPDVHYLYQHHLTSQNNGAAVLLISTRIPDTVLLGKRSFREKVNWKRSDLRDS